MYTVMTAVRTSQIFWLALPVLLGLAGAASATKLSGAQLVAALRRGGYVIVMRHASSPRTPPDAATADPDNVRHERQLDELGRASAQALGDALRRLKLPLGEVLSSPTYRALETARLAQLTAKADPELGEAGHSMQTDPTGARGAWLRARAAMAPARGTDTLLITHFPNIAEAFSSEAGQLEDGEALIFRPDGRGSASLVARIKIDEWPRLASGS
jgi:phosphohistidine phosphatase SixA